MGTIYHPQLQDKVSLVATSGPNDDRGGWDASGNVFPSTGGSGVAGAIEQGNYWLITVAGTLGGTPVSPGWTIRALIDTPGQTAINWAITAPASGGVSSVFGRTDAVVAATNDYTWVQINKATSSLADITTRSATDLNSGTLLAARMPALTGDVTSSAGSVATTIANNAVSLAKLADIVTASFLGRNTAGTGDPEALSIATAKTMLDLTGTNSGDVTLAGENYLSIAAQVITANAINLTGTHVTGVLPSAKGGTGSSFFGVGGLSGLRSFTFPDANATIARTDTGQTFTGTNNFQHVLPTSTDTYDLGSSIKLWRKGWLSELDAVLFAQNTASVIGGWLIIGKNEGLIPVGQDVGSGDTTIDFGQAMTLNDFVLFRAALQVEYVQVGSLVSGTRYNVTRNVDGSGANAWVGGTVYLVLGNTGNGRIELNSNLTPRISLITQGSAYNTQTEMLRVGDLNGSWGVSSETYGFAVGQYGVAGKSALRIDDSGIRFFNNITERIRLLADGSGYVANSSIAWDTAGVLNVTANATIAGWAVTSSAITSGATTIASNADIPGGAISWFGRGSSGYGGTHFSDSSGRYVQSIAGNGSVYPYLVMNDGTRMRLAIGGLNTAWGSDGSTDSMGMKIWSAAGTKLLEFSDVQNMISGWTIGAAKISSTGIDINSGGSAGLAFGTTPPTSASVGTGIWLDRTGLYGLASSVVQAKVDASTGALTAGAGEVVVDSGGITILSDTTFKNTASLKFKDYAGGLGTNEFIAKLRASRASTLTIGQLLAQSPSSETAERADALVSAANSGGSANHLQVTMYGSSHATYASKRYVAVGSLNGGMLLSAFGTASEIGDSFTPSTILELNSTTGAFLPPRMTTTERDALTASDGMILYNSTTGSLNYRKAGAWVAI